VKPATRLALGVAAVLVVMLAAAAAAVTVSIATAQRDIGQSQQQWCDALQLLTASPVPRPADPAGNPSRESEYRLYQDFVRLRKVFGCK
jgi:hypothetical protein